MDVVNFNKLKKKEEESGKVETKKKKNRRKGFKKKNDLNEVKFSSFASSSEYSRTAGEGRCFGSAFSDFTMARFLSVLVLILGH